MSPSPVTATVFAHTDMGRTREHNEDAYLVGDLSTGKTSFPPSATEHQIGPRGLLLLVADGMGGAAAGELASAMAADLIFGHMAGTWTREQEIDSDRFILRLREAVELANLQIHAYAREHPEVRGMGTTATVAGILGTRLYLAQVGDSRCYMVRQGVATLVTKDQSLTQRLVDAGELTEQEAEASARRNIILQALGPDARIRVDLTFEDLCAGDVLVLCSDGLSGLVKREEIAEAVARVPDLETLGNELIGTANARGGPDNITAVVARFEGGELPTPGDGEDPEYRVYQTDEPHGVVEAPRPAALAPPPVAIPATRTGSPAGMALLVAGAILVLLAAFIFLAG